jgi:hypothetical protein
MVERDEELVSRVARHPLLAEFRKETRAKLIKLESRVGGIEIILGRIEERQADRGQKTQEMERKLEEFGKVARGPMSWLTWERLLIVAVLLGMVFSRLGVDPLALVR